VDNLEELSDIERLTNAFNTAETKWRKYINTCICNIILLLNTVLYIIYTIIYCIIYVIILLYAILRNTVHIYM